MWGVLIFLALFAIISYIVLKGAYIEFKELGENYVDVFWTNLTLQYSIVFINFFVLYIIMYATNKGIKKGLKVFFDQEKKEMPKLPNKSISLIVSVIVSVIMGRILMPKIALFNSGASFGISDPIFNLDISYYMFMKPIISIFVLYFIILMVALSGYMALYYVIVFNIHFDGVERETLKKSSLMKKIVRNAKMVAIGIAILMLLNVQNILFQKFITLEDETELVGAGLTEATIQVWGYGIFSIIIIISIFRALNNFKASDIKKSMKSLMVIPAYLIGLFIITVGFDLLFVKTNELDKEKEFISYSINNTKDAYNINIDEVNVEYSGTVTLNETQKYQEVIKNVTVVSKEAVLNTLADTQTRTGYYSYKNATIGKYKIDGRERLVYLAPREIVNKSRTYNNKTYEYTHGMGEIIVSATNTTQSGTIDYVQNDISGKDNVINITEPRIYFGLETNDTIATNTTNKKEYDYTSEDGTEYEYSYEGNAGLELGFFDRLILGIRKGDLNLAFSSSINKKSKLLINRNIIERAKTALPNLIYDSKPYTVINNDGNIIWVLDAYTISNSYPYSSYINIEYEGSKQKINYIRNSVKVLINSYTGEMKFYITDRTDPIAMAYRNIYPTLFENIDNEIPKDIADKFIYPQYIYNIQAQMLKTFHNVKPDVLYRSDDLWDIAKYNTTQTTKSSGSTLGAYYTMINAKDEENSKLALVQMFTPSEKQNIISYLVGSYDGEEKLKLYKFSSDNSILGPMQLDNQIEQDKTISAELKSLNTTGTKITKQMIIVPIENTLLYVEPIYQTMLNESNIPLLKKVVVASGSKVAIGTDLNEALNNLLSQYAVNIEVENTDDIEGLIQAIIKANNNLTDSNKSNNWEQMGSDMKKLQELINTLQQMKEAEEAKKSEENQENIVNEEEINEEENLIQETE